MPAYQTHPPARGHSLRAGRYTLIAQKGSFVSVMWGQKRFSEPGKLLEILDGQTIDKVDFWLPRGGAITGRILDEFGEPASDAQVSALHVQHVDGARRLMAAGRFGSTNDLGEFRIFGLPPGDYFVSAMLRNPIGDATDRSDYAPTYYPGTPDAATGQRIAVAVGQTVTDISFALQSIQTARIRGTAVDSQNRPLQGVVTAQQRTMVVGGPLSILPGSIQPDGSFTINGVAPGDYTLQVLGQPSLAGNEAEYAAIELNVQGADVTGVRIVGAQPSTLAGRLVITSGDPKTLKPSTFRVSAAPVMSAGQVVMGPIRQRSVVNDDWAFHLKVRPGVMRIQVEGLQSLWNVKAVRYRGADVTDAGVEVRPNEDLEDLQVEVSDRTTDISGTVTTARGEPVTEYSVVFFGRDHSTWTSPSRFVRSSRPDQDGRFKIRGLPPGAYLVIAAAAMDLGELDDPEFLGRLLKRARRTYRWLRGRLRR